MKVPNDIIDKIKCCRLCENCFDDLDEGKMCSKCNSQYSNFKLADEAERILNTVYDVAYYDGWEEGYDTHCYNNF